MLTHTRQPYTMLLYLHAAITMLLCYYSIALYNIYNMPLQSYKHLALYLYVISLCYKYLALYLYVKIV